MLRGLVDRFLKYAAASVAAVAAGEIVLVIAFGLLGWSARAANLASFPVGTTVSFLLNRAWVWGRRGRENIGRELVAFWALAFAGLALSTWAVGVAEDAAADAGRDRSWQAAAVVAASLAAYGAVWIVKFVMLNWLLFRQPAEAVAAAQPSVGVAVVGQPPGERGEHP